MGNDSAPKIIIFFTISLLFTSIVVSWMLLQAYGIAVSGISLEMFGGAQLSSIADIKGGVNVSGSTDMGDWEYQSGVGYVSTSTNNYFLFNKVATNQEGNFINQYSIKNENLQDYSIVIARSVFGTQEVSVEYDGYHVRQAGFLGDIISSEIYFQPFTGANQNPYADIKTEYCAACLLNPNDEGDALKYYVDGALMFTVPTSKLIAFGGQPDQMTPVYYGGVGSKDNVGLVIEKLSNSLTTGDAAGVSDLIAYMFTLMKLLTWGIDAQYLPYEINLLLIKSQEFAILVGIIGMFWK